MGITPQKLQYYGEAGNLNGLASLYGNQGVAEITKTKRTRHLNVNAWVLAFGSQPAVRERFKGHIPSR